MVVGVGLVVSGMINPAKVIGVLDVTGAWDPTLFAVMAGAIGVFAPLNYLIRKFRSQALSGAVIPASVQGKISTRLIVGSATFGIGWGASGICPGPALTGIAMGHVELLVFIPALIVGMIVAQKLFGADA